MKLLWRHLIRGLVLELERNVVKSPMIRAGGDLRVGTLQEEVFEMEILYVLYNILSVVVANFWLLVTRTLFYL